VKPLISIVLGVLVAALLPRAYAQEKDPLYITLGARVQGGGWEGNNENSSDTSFDSDNGGTFGLRLVMQKGRLYGGISLQGGEYDFENGSPDRIFGAPLPLGSISDDKATIKRGEADLLVGYYFWERVSLFADIKNVTNEWQSENYSLRYTGLGFGVSGFIPLNERWTLFGTLGIVPRLNIRNDSDGIGKGTGSALEFGVVWRMLDATNMVFSLRNQHQEYDFDNDAKQTHDIGGIAIGINHRFEVL